MESTKRTCVVCAMDHDARILYQGKYPNTRADAARLIGDTLSRYDCIAVCESTGNLWLKTFEMFEQADIPIRLANPYRLKLSQSGTKTDKIDARTLANRLRMDDVPTCHMYPPEIRDIRDILHLRISLVQHRTALINHQHAIMDKYDYNTTSGHGNTSGDKYQAYLNGLKLKNGDTRIMAHLVRLVRNINSEIYLT